MSEITRPRYTKAYEAWSTLFVTEMISVPITPVLAALKISPNLITILSLLTGLTTGFFFARGQWIAGAMFFELACLFDNVDGKVARIRGMTSDLGVKLEFIADTVRKPSSFIGIAFFFYSQQRPLFVILTAAFFIAHFGLHKLFKLAGVSEYDLEFPNFHRRICRKIAPRLLNLNNFFDEQFLEFVIFPLIMGIIGPSKGAAWFFYGAALVTCLGLLKLANSIMYLRRGRYHEIYQDFVGTKGMLDKVNEYS